MKRERLLRQRQRWPEERWCLCVSSADDSYEVRISRSAQKYLRRAEPAACRRLLEALSKMQQNPWAGDVQPVQGHADRWRRRIGGLRVVYSVDRLNRNSSQIRGIPTGTGSQSAVDPASVAKAWRQSPSTVEAPRCTNLRTALHQRLRRCSMWLRHSSSFPIGRLTRW